MSLRRLTAAIVALVAIGALSIGCSSSDDDSEATAEAMEPVTVNISVDEFSINSDLTDFKVGQPYHFVLTNGGVAPHELMLIEPMETGTMPMTEMDEMAVAVVEEDDLPAGASYEFDVTFDHAYDDGTLEFACHLAGHYEAGMHVPVTVHE